MKGHGPKGHGPWGGSILRDARSNFGVSEMHSVRSLKVLTFVCLAVTRLKTMKLQGGDLLKSGIETYRFTREAVQ